MTSHAFASPVRSAALALLLSALLAGPALAQSWRFAYMSDHRSSLGHHPGVSTTTVSRLVADIRTNGIDLLLIGGDLIHGDGQPTSGLIDQYDVFKSCLAPLTNAGIPYYAIPGNHEFWSENSSWSESTNAWWQTLGRHMPQNGPTSPCPERGMTYSFNHKSALFLGVNMYTNVPTSWFYKGADTNWVQTQLAGNTNTHVFAFGHVPQTMIASNDATVQTTVDLWNLLAGARCCAYFCGHKHSYQRTLTRAPNGAGYIHEVMDGSGMDVINSNGPPWWGSGNPIAVEYLCSDDTMRGYVLVDVDGLNVSVTRRCFYTNAADEVFWTNMDSFAYTVVATPTNVRASDGDYTAKVLVAWDPAGGAIGYEVWRGTTPAATNRILIATVTNSTYSDTTAVPVVRYYYWVRGTNADGVSLHSSCDTGWRNSSCGLTDFDGDGKTDVAVYQETTGRWSMLLSGNDYAPAGATLGGVGAIAISGDFDGDGKTDVAIYQESAGLWSILLSGNGYAPAGAMLGGVGATPVSGDFDGDGKTDVAVYQESAGLWSILLSGSDYAPAGTTLGGVGSVPVSGDFDGDGKTDVAVYQESTGRWSVLFSGSGYASASATLGGVGAVPVAGDFDGDRKTDMAIYQESAGRWSVLLSGSRYALATTTWGGVGAVPVSGDYNGDGKTDLAVYQESAGRWSILLSGSGYAPAGATLGGVGYTPVP